MPDVSGLAMQPEVRPRIRVLRLTTKHITLPGQLVSSERDALHPWLSRHRESAEKAANYVSRLARRAAVSNPRRREWPVHCPSKPASMAARVTMAAATVGVMRPDGVPTLRA